MGDTVPWADFFLSAFFMYLKTILGEDSEEWKDVASWNEGRWKNLLHALRVRSGYQLVSKHKGRDRIVKITVLLKFERDQGFKASRASRFARKGI